MCNRRKYQTSIRFLPLILFRGRREAGAYPSCHTGWEQGTPWAGHQPAARPAQTGSNLESSNRYEGRKMKPMQKWLKACFLSEGHHLCFLISISCPIEVCGLQPLQSLTCWAYGPCLNNKLNYYFFNLGHTMFQNGESKHLYCTLYKY